MGLLERLYKLVRGNPGHNGGYYASKLGGVTRRQVNRCLYSNDCFFNSSETDCPAWRVVAEIHWPRPVAELTELRVKVVPELSVWQSEAYDSWVRHEKCGIVEAVTGSGKTRLAIAAIQQVSAIPGRSVVVVPTVVLLHQWERELRSTFPNIPIGLFGDGHGVTDAQITIAVVNSLAAVMAEPETAPFQETLLLVADEVHRYGAPNFSRALLPSARFRLGLTATLERTDDGVDQVLHPYFGNLRESVYRCDFKRAREDGRLAPARIALLGVKFNTEELEAYNDAYQRAWEAKSTLRHNYGLGGNPHQFFAVAQRLAAEEQGEGTILARTWLRARSDASRILANATGKRTAALSLSSLFGNRHSGIVFCQRIAAADRLSTLFAAQSLRSAALHCEISRENRRLMLQQLSDGRLDLLTTATALDEGIDVPNIDTGIIISSTQQRRQMIQRLGRVLRAKPDGRRARVVITYALGTWEDPAVGKKRAEFAEFAADAAGEPGAYKDFKQDWNVEKVREFFANGCASRTSLIQAAVVDGVI